MTSELYPECWTLFWRHVTDHDCEDFGFVGGRGEVVRFATRFRAARAFRGIDLDGYSEATAGGYSALCRVLFVWSAFERFLAIVGIAQRDAGALLEAHGALVVRDRVRMLDRNERFYDFIYQRVNAAHRRELDAYRGEDPFNFTYLASAIRHMFAHGHLSPNANNVSPVTCVRICDELCELLLRVMNREFADRVAAVVGDC